MRYKGQKLIAAVATKIMPTHPHGVLGPTKTRLMRANPNTNLTILSMLPIFAFIPFISKLSQASSVLPHAMHIGMALVRFQDTQSLPKSAAR